MAAIKYHYETMGRILSYLIQRGLKRVDLDDSDAMEIMTERHGDEEEVIQAFADVLNWMLSEGLIRAHSVQEYDGGFAFSGVQLSSRGIAAIQAKTNDPALGESVEKTVNEKGSLDSNTYSKIGSFIGGFVGGCDASLVRIMLEFRSPNGHAESVAPVPSSFAVIAA